MGDFTQCLVHLLWKYNTRFDWRAGLIYFLVLGRPVNGKNTELTVTLVVLVLDPTHLGAPAQHLGLMLTIGKGKMFISF